MGGTRARSRAAARDSDPESRESREAALARLYDLDLSDDPGDLDLYLALAARTGDPVVELAVGTGRLAVPLAAAGHDVIGIDDDPAMLARADARARAMGGGARNGARGARRAVAGGADRSDAGGAGRSQADGAGRGEAGGAARGVADPLRLVDHDMVDVDRSAIGLGEAPNGGAGLVILGLNSILLLADRSRQRAVLATMSALLRPGGVAAIDVWLPAVEDLARFDGRLSLEWLRTDPDTGAEVTKTAAAWYDETSRIVTLTTIFEASLPGGAPARWTRAEAMRLIGADELRAFAEDAGLVIEQLAGDHDLGPFGPGSERAVLVARKPG